jgi:uncharacterized Tic20 family protein
MTENNENPQAPENAGAGQPNQPVIDAQPVGAGQPEINKDARMWAMFCHLAGLAGLVVPVIGCVIGPLVLWQIKKEEFPFVDEQGKEAVNFQISMLIYGVASTVLVFCGVGLILAPVVGIFDLIFLLIAAVKTNNGEHYQYPLTIRFVK